VAAVLLAACGSSGGATSGLASAYGTTLKAGTATVSFLEEISVSGHTERLDATGVTSFTTNTEDVSSDDNGTTVEIRYVNGYLYLKLPPSEAKSLGAGKSWAAIDLSRLTGSTNPTIQELSSLGGQSGTNFLGFLKSVTSVRKTGTTTINGAPATGYDAIINLADFAQSSAVPASQRSAVVKELGATGTFPLKLWVDDHDRVVRETFKLTAHPATSSTGSAPITVLAEVSLSHFGESLHVVAPPAAQTQDITSTFAGVSPSPSPSS
jgi:hypothetical protein